MHSPFTLSYKGDISSLHSGSEHVPIAQQQLNQCYSHCVDWNQGTGKAAWAVLIQVTENNVIHFVKLAKHSALNSKEYAATHSVLLKEFYHQF